MALESRTNKDGTKSYRARVWDPVLKRWYPSPWTQDPAQARQDELDLEVKKTKGGKSGAGEARTTSVAEYWEVWAEYRRDDTSAGWKISQDQMWRDHVQPTLGKLKMIDVKAHHIGLVMTSLKTQGYADNTRKHVYNLMNQMFSDAVGYYEMLEDSPVKTEFHKPAVIENERDFWTPEQAWQFLEHVQTIDRWRKTMLDLAPAAWLQIQGALRVGEVQALRWPNVLFGSNEIRVCEMWNNKVGELQPYPKGKKPNYVPMTPALKRFLLARYAEATSEYVSPAWNGRIMSYETYNRALKRSCGQAGLAVLTTHSLRHSATEIWIQAGASQEDIRRLLNHASLTSTKRYIHRSEGRLQALSQAILPGSALRVIPGGGGGTQEITHENYPSGYKKAECRSESGSA